MKVVFIDRYRGATNFYKDPLTIPDALAARGHSVTLADVDEWRGTMFGLAVEPLSTWRESTSGQNRPDAVVALTRFDPKLTPVLQQIKAQGIRLIVKGDTDGTAGYPVPPNYLRSRPLGANPINFLRHLKWRLPLGSVVRPRLEHIALADATVVESPGAAVNLSQVLWHWNRVRDLATVQFIPNPVAPTVCDRPLPVGTREKTVVSVGRWDDPVKGADLLRGTIERTLRVRRDYSFVIVGDGGELVRAKLPEEHAGFVRCTGKLPFERTLEVMSSARILLVPSYFESFSFVTAEALCSGASVVVTPIESLIYLSGGGANGSIARGFDAKALTAALLCEMQEWERGGRDPASIASEWRSKLSLSRIGAIWEQVLQGASTGPRPES